MTPPLGAHVSIAGGLFLAIERGADLGCDAVQIFVKNASQWRGKRLLKADVDRFRAAHAASVVGPVVAHASYLINLAATDAATLRRSRRALADELARCERLGVDALVVHPGAHLEAGEERGLERVAASLDRVLSSRPAPRPRLLLENTAGQGTVLGYRLEQLAAIRGLAERGERIGVCIDTCHAFAAGYRLDERRGYDRFFADLDSLFTTAALGCMHLNDSRHRRGSRRDRHANLGKGEIGEGLFRRLVRDPRLAGTPMIVETPRGDDGRGHARDLALLRSLARSAGGRGGGTRGRRKTASRGRKRRSTVC